MCAEITAIKKPQKPFFESDPNANREKISLSLARALIVTTASQTILQTPARFQLVLLFFFSSQIGLGVILNRDILSRARRLQEGQRWAQQTCSEAKLAQISSIESIHVEAFR